jgi:hypothetical protein
MSLIVYILSLLERLDDVGSIECRANSSFLIDRLISRRRETNTDKYLTVCAVRAKAVRLDTCNRVCAAASIAAPCKRRMRRSIQCGITGGTPP